jgi:hypothetical protein
MTSSRTTTSIYIAARFRVNGVSTDDILLATLYWLVDTHAVNGVSTYDILLATLYWLLHILYMYLMEYLHMIYSCYTVLASRHTCSL